MSDEPIEGVMGSLPRTRPHRRSTKRGPVTEPIPAAKAKTSGARGAAGSAGAPVRSLQSATAPRAASDRSRKPGATSQAHRTTARPKRPPRSAPPAAEPAGALGTAVQAAAELTEIGLKASARALRGALSRLPRP